MNLLTLTIMVVGISTGAEADKSLSCERYERRGKDPALPPRCTFTGVEDSIAVVSNIIFTVEVTRDNFFIKAPSRLS